MKYLTEFAQNIKEIDWLIEIFRRENVSSFLEVGSRYGGSLWRIANSMPKGSKVVCVDLPEGYGGRKDGLENLDACIAHLNRDGYLASMFLGDSTDPKTVENVKALSPFDACFIDASHIERFVRQDWANYGSMSRIVAFHDIGWRRESSYGGTRIDVPIVWEELKKKYRHEEIKLDKKDNGIGVLWKN